MMVLQVTNTGTAPLTVLGLSLPAGASEIFPADRCIWRSTYNAATKAYEIGAASFFPGNTATGVPLSGTNRSVELGTIGKSGRFVSYTQ